MHLATIKCSLLHQKFLVATCQQENGCENQSVDSSGMFILVINGDDLKDLSSYTAGGCGVKFGVTDGGKAWVMMLPWEIAEAENI